jgi:hypothetical protein
VSLEFRLLKLSPPHSHHPYDGWWCHHWLWQLSFSLRSGNSGRHGIVGSQAYGLKIKKHFVLTVTLYLLVC